MDVQGRQGNPFLSHRYLRAHLYNVRSSFEMQYCKIFTFPLFLKSSKKSGTSISPIITSTWRYCRYNCWSLQVQEITVFRLSIIQAIGKQPRKRPTNRHRCQLPSNNDFNSRSLLPLHFSEQYFNCK